MKKLKRLFADKKFVKRLHAKKVFGFSVAVGAGFLAATSQANAQVIISDTFSSGSTYGSTDLPGASVSGTNLPGGTYFLTGNTNGYNKLYDDAGQQSGNPTDGLGTPYYAAFQSNTGSGNGVGITLGSYNTGTLAVTGDVLGYNTGYGQQPSTPDLTTAYVGVGFSSLTPGTASANYSSTDARSSFTGLLAEGSGALQEYVNGTAVGSAIAYGGTYSSTTAEVLSYDLNTATGAITDVSFGSSTATYSFLTSSSFSNSDTVSAEILGSGGTGTGANLASAEYSQGQLGSYSIDEAAAVVPEPSSLALMTGGLVALGALGLRRRNNNV